MLLAVGAGGICAGSYHFCINVFIRRSVCGCDCMPRLRAEAGSRPAGESLSFASPKERNQRKGDPTVCVPCADATGQPAVLGFGGVSLNSRRCASLRQTRALIRQTLRSSAHPEGQGEQNIHTGHRCARHRIAGASATRCESWAEQSDGPNGCPAVWMFGCPTLLAAPAAGRLWGGTRVAARVLRALTRRGCLNEAATQRSEFHGAPRSRPAAGLPLRNAKGSQTGGRLSFGYFSLAKQRKVPRPPGRLPASALNKGAPPNQRTQQNTTKSIATAAYPTSASSPKPLKQAPKPSVPTKSPTHPSHAASPPGYAPPAWRHNRPCPPRTAPTAHPASWHPAPPARCSPPA